MRLFAALPIAEDVRNHLDRLLRRLEERDLPVRWVPPHALHVTVKFYGEVTESQGEAIATALGKVAAGTGVLPMSLAGTGAFPVWRRARVVWIGLEAPPALELLQHRVEAASAELGFPLERATFVPHLTLGRVREGSRLSDAALIELQGIRVEGSFVAESLVLYESHLTTAGASYSPLGTCSLA
jgi:2'-5' RNA ligase